MVFASVERRAPAAPSAAASPLRRHDLDALRGAVMVLGIALHAALPFFADIWPIPEPTKSMDSGFDEFVNAVHGFRMQVFFVLSGFFSAVLLARRGPAALLTHRGKRVLLPLGIGILTVVPLVDLAGTGSVPSYREWATSTLALHHLWFLWFLCLYVGALTLAYAALRAVRGRRSRPVPAAVRALGFAAVGAVTLATQHAMIGGGPERPFGPALSNRLAPDGPTLAYYGAFFAFGVALWAARSPAGERLVDTVGAHWPALLAGSLLVVFPLARLTTGFDPMGSQLEAALLQTAYSWGMVLGLIGLFRKTLGIQRRAVRYLADASYWMYLMHLPVLIVVHRGINEWPVPALVKFVVLCALTTAVLLASYQAFVRHTAIGRLLNGPVLARNGAPSGVR